MFKKRSRGPNLKSNMGVNQRLQARRHKNCLIDQERSNRSERVRLCIEERKEVLDHELSAFAAQVTWKFLKSTWEVEPGQKDDDKDLIDFFRHIMTATVSQEVVSKAVLPYTMDKFETRIDLMFNALVQTEQLLSFSDLGNGTLHVASVGGGPGNDLVGVYLYVKCFMASSEFHGVCFDFCDSWGDIVSQVSSSLISPSAFDVLEKVDNAARWSARYSPSNLLLSKLEFSVCDLKLGPHSSVNSNIVRDIDLFDIICFSYVLFETAAHEYTLLSYLLDQCKVGSLTIILDLHTITMNRVIDMIEANRFQQTLLGSTKEFRFKGLALRKLR